MNEYEEYSANKLLDTLSNCKQQIETVKQDYLNSVGMFADVQKDVQSLLNNIVNLYKVVDSMKNQ